MLPDYTVSIILPLYKPVGGWADDFLVNMHDLSAYLSDEIIQFIVVHDGPIDAEVSRVFELIAEHMPTINLLHYEENRGKGYALRHGVSAAKAPHLLLIDFDFPYKMENIRTLLKELRSGADVVVGKRNRAYFRQAPLKRTLVSKLFSTLNKLLLPLPLYDTQSGIKGFNHFGKAVYLQTVTDRFLVDTEFLVRVHKTNLSVGIIDIELRPHVIFSDFGMKVVKTELINFLHIIRISRRLKPSQEVIQSTPVMDTAISLRA